MGGVNAKALTHQVLALWRDAIPKPKVGGADLLVRFEGDVAAHHVKEEDAKGPDCGKFAVVTVLTNPLGWRVHSSS